MRVAVLAIGVAMGIAAVQPPAAPGSRPAAEVRDFRSTSNGQLYRLFIARPAGYDESTAYPVVYLLDGDLYFDLAAGIQRVLGYGGDLPKVVLVGIGYGGTVDDVRAKRIDRKSVV